MSEPTEALFRVFKESFAHVDWVKLKATDPDKYSNITGNITVSLSGSYEKELNELRAAIEARNLQIGNYINNGSAAYLFEIKDKENNVIPNVILRIEPASITDATKSSVVRWPLAHIDAKNGDAKHDGALYYQATIMPRATRPEKPNPEFLVADAQRSLAMLNSEGQLKKATDIGLKQFMLMQKPDGKFVSYRDGTPVAVIGDQNCMSGLAGLGGIKLFCASSGLDQSKVEARKESPEEVAFVRAQMDELHSHARNELIKHHVVVDPIPTSQISPSVSAVGAEAVRAVK